MEFRPCIDIHNGKIKQIVGGSINDHINIVTENFVSQYDGAYYGEFYKKYKLKGGHIIILNPKNSEFYEQSLMEAQKALKAYPNGLQIGGGVTSENAKEFINAGASHVIVTSYVFSDGKVNMDNLEKLLKAVGKEHIVIDLSCRKKKNEYYIVTNRWQNFTDVILNKETLDFFKDYADEFLIHAVDVEGKLSGIEEDLVRILGTWDGIPITYAGGVHSKEDLSKLKLLGNNKIHVTIGSALDLFGGAMNFQETLEFIKL